MSSFPIECPHCGEPFELTEALAAPLLDAERDKVKAEVARQLDSERAAISQKAAAAVESQFVFKLKASEAAIADRDAKLLTAQAAELSLRREREQLEQAKRELDLTVQRRVDAEKEAAAKAAVAAAESQYLVKLKAQQAEIAERDVRLKTAQEAELSIRREREQLEQAKRELDLNVQRRVDEEKSAAVKAALEQADRENAAKLRAAESSLADKDAKLKVAEQAELEARKLKQEAEEAMRQAELTVVRRLDEERSKVREAAVRERDDEYRLKLGEKDKQLELMRQQIEELRRKGENASQQLIGDVMELDLLEVLRSAFPGDEFERVKKGESGADVLQTVRNRTGQPCGRILWESKRTKNWNDGWLGKLREDQRAAKADVAALMTETLPATVQHFDYAEGVWVTGVPTVVPMAMVLRQGIIETANARAAAASAGSTKDLIYGYLTGTEFRQRVRGAIEPIIEMRTELDSERRVITKRWSVREKQLERSMHSLAGMYGDLQGLAGRSLPDVEGLALLELEESGETPKLAVVNSDMSASSSNDQE